MLFIHMLSTSVQKIIHQKKTIHPIETDSSVYISLRVIQPPIQLYPPALTGIAKPLQVLHSNHLQRLQILVAQLALQAPKILLDVVWMRTLRYDRSASAHPPTQCHRCRSASSVLRDFLELIVLKQQGRGIVLLRGSVGRVQVGKWRIRRHVDTAGLVIL